MNAHIMYSSLFGFFSLAAIIILLKLVWQKRTEYALALASCVLSILFCYSAVTSSSSNSPVWDNFLLSSMVAALFAIPLIWKPMFIRFLDYTWQWAFLVLMIAIILINQFLLQSVSILLLPSAAVCFVILVKDVIKNKGLSDKVELLEEELNAKKVSIGLDLATGLPNKLAFCDYVDKWLFVNKEMKLNIVVFKFTKFQKLNALIGHSNSDIVKLQMITRLKNLLAGNRNVLMITGSRDQTCFATLGGVDFALAIKDVTSEFATDRVIEVITNSVNEPIVIGASAVDVGVRFGVSTYPEQGYNTEGLIENAYLAMQDFADQTDSYYFNKKLKDKFNASKAVINQLKDDLNKGKFEVHVQPQVQLETKAIIGGELLVRWQRDNTGLIKADQFITFAEQSGIIYQLNLWTIEQAIKMLAEFKQQSLPQTLSVNISNREVFQSQFVESIEALIERYEIEPDKLILEIKESAFAENLNRALKVVRLLQKVGVHIAIDDFGKDQMALGTFNHFTPKYLKIDCRALSKGSKVDALGTYTNAIIGMAQSLQIEVIAQGIEVESTEAQLNDLECKFGQGFLYSKPFELSGFIVWMEQWQRAQKNTSIA